MDRVKVGVFDTFPQNRQKRKGNPRKIDSAKEVSLW